MNINIPGGPLEDRDYASLESRWITRDVADGALLRRVISIDGMELLSAQGRPGNFAGILIPYVWPGKQELTNYRIRRDQPDMEANHEGGISPKRKYMGQQGARNSLYLHPQVEESWLGDLGLPIVIVEGEFKTLALWRLAWHGLGDVADSPAFLPVGLQGVYSWRTKLGRTPGAGPGEWHDVKGPVPDLGRIAWTGRRVIVLFDSNVEENASVGMARRALTQELESRGAEISWFKWPKDVPSGINGIDDFLAQRGPDEAVRLLAKSRKVTRKRKVVTVAAAVNDGEEDWKSELIRSDNGGIKPILANAITFLMHAPELEGMLSWDEFAVRVMALQGTPWNPASREWGEVDDIRLAEWLQHKGCHVNKGTTSEAVAAVARERSFHPVREYLSRLTWDGTPRIDTWLRDYVGVEDSTYSRAVGSRWLISAVARVMEPGCQADHCLILQGPQGRRKSSALRVLAGEWFTDQVGDLAQKDSAQAIHGVWIVEFGELEQVLGMRSEMAVVKAFITRRVDRFRPPYERRPADFPRQCIFAGSVNLNEFLRDETGARRFWPVTCGPIDVAGLERERDQIWAEARARYEAKAVWWLDDAELVQHAEDEQDARYEEDPWDGLIWGWIEVERKLWVDGRNPASEFEVTAEDLLLKALKKPEAAWQHADKMRIGRILRRHGLVRRQTDVVDFDGNLVRTPKGGRQRKRSYMWPLEEPAAVS
jgi:predicted P-loop ATPase